MHTYTTSGATSVRFFTPLDYFRCASNAARARALPPSGMFAGDERRASTDSEVSNASTELELQGSLSPHEERPHPTKGPTSKLAPLAQISAQRVSPLGGRTLESVPETPPEAAMFSGGSMAFASEITQRNAAAAAESALWGRPRAVAKAAGEGATRSEGGAKGGETREVHRQNAASCSALPFCQHPLQS